MNFTDKKPILLNKNVPVLEATRELLLKNKSHAILLDEWSKPYGVVSIKDIAKALFIEGEEGIEIIEAGSLDKVLKSPIKYYSSSPIISITSITSLNEVIELMRKRNIGYLPVIENGKVLGAIDERNLLKAIPDNIDMSPCHVANWEPLTIDYEEEITVAVGLMLGKNAKQILVVKEKEIYGMTSILKILYYIFTEPQLNLLVKGSRKPLEQPVALVSENPWRIDCSYSLKEVASILFSERLGGVLIEDNGKFGIINDRDLIASLLL